MVIRQFRKVVQVEPADIERFVIANLCLTGHCPAAKGKGEELHLVAIDEFHRSVGPDINQRFDFDDYTRLFKHFPSKTWGRLFAGFEHSGD